VNIHGPLIFSAKETMRSASDMVSGLSLIM
jgi:hypothetical protein